MKIINAVSANSKEQKVNDKFLSTILDHVVAISKEDKNFSNSKKIERLDMEIKTLSEKVDKQNNLLGQAKKIEDETNERLTDIDEQNFTMKSRLLEILGSEL